MAVKIRLMGIQFHHYIDDWLIVADTPQQAIKHARYVINLAIALGWIPNWTKSNLIPTQTFEYVGVAYDLSRGLALPPMGRVDKLVALAQVLIGSRSCTARSLLSLIGLIASMEKQVPFGRCFMRPIQWCLALQWKISTDRLDHIVTLDDRAVEAIRWWMAPGHLYRGMTLDEYVPDRDFFTDASQVAWGAHMDDLELSIMWSDHDRTFHINVLELRAVLRAYQQWHSLYPQGTKWLVFTDNTTVVAHINKQGGTRALPLCLEAEKLLRLVYSRGHFLRARHIPGKMNVIADYLSRPDRILGTEWSLCPGVFKRMCQIFGAPNIDLFATSRNAKLPVFYSPLPESTALGTDAMVHRWDGMYAYAYPPTGFIAEVLRKVERSSCEILLVAPRRPTQPWYPLLLSLLVEVPRVLPAHSRLLRQPGTSVFHDSPLSLGLLVWRLSNNPTSRQAFLNKCQSTCHERTVDLPQQLTRPSGEYSFVGVTEGRLIRSLPL